MSFTSSSVSQLIIQMVALIKLVYILIVLSIAADFINLGSHWFNTDPNGGEISVHSSSLLLPGASGWSFLTKSAIKALKKKAKNQAKKKGNTRNKSRKTQGGSGK